MFCFKFVKAYEIKAFLIKSIWVEAGLRESSKEFTTNDVESENVIIKYVSHFDKKKIRKYL